MRFLIGIIFLITIINSPYVLADQPVQPTLNQSSQQVKQSQNAAQKQITEPTPLNSAQTSEVPNTTQPIELAKTDAVKQNISQIKQAIGSNTQFLTYKDLIKRSIKGIAVGIGAFLVFIFALVLLKKKTNPQTQHKQSYTSSSIKQAAEIDISQAVINYIKHKF